MPILYMLFGAALVTMGVVASAYADRIRQLRVSREPALREKVARVVSAAAVTIPAVESSAQPPKAKPKSIPETSEDAEDVIAALVAAKYKKPVAAEAVWACSSAERATIESWTAAALRRCMRGAAS